MKKVYNVGIYTNSKYSVKVDKKAYALWKSILQRCYDEKLHYRYPSYIGCEICEDWKYFENFAKWFYDNYIDGYTLDKDILGNGKLYSPETCCFVPNHINNILHDNKHNANGLGQGVRLEGNRYRVRVNTISTKRKHIGYFKSKEEAQLAYMNAKLNATKEIINHYNINDKITTCIIEKILSIKNEYYGSIL